MEVRWPALTRVCFVPGSKVFVYKGMLLLTVILYDGMGVLAADVMGIGYAAG